MTYKIESAYKALTELVTDKIGIFTKTDVDSFETIPGIGFGLCTISSPDVVSNRLTVQLEIPVRIVNEGAQSVTNITLTNIYEDFVAAIRLYLQSYMTSNGVNCSYIEIEQFNQMVTMGDTLMKGLDGNLKIIIEV
ncbi:MAG: hypothetical protein K8E24_013030 [Methanobacterium paludis]|nr:hypothetical protein [Methanobacterium paludis]